MNKYKSKIQKRPLILFSGGLDSTYMLLSQLAISSVDLLIVKSNRLPDGQNAEIIARDKIITKIKQDTESGKLKHSIVNIYTINQNITFETPFSISDENGDKFAQLKYWIFSALEILNPEIHSHLYIGYVAGDQITPHIHNIKKAWKHLCRVSKTCKIKISFPLIYMSKQNIIDRLKFTHNEEFLNLVWFCEFPLHNVIGKGKKKHTEFKPCGECLSCKRMSELNQLDSSVMEKNTVIG